MSLVDRFMTPPSSNREDIGRGQKPFAEDVGSNPTGGFPGLFEGVEDKHALRAIFLAGSGGSGKGAVRDAMFAGTGFKVIDQDKHLERFMKDAKLPLSKVGQRYDLLKKAQWLKARELRQYAMRRLPIIVDSMGWDYKRVASPAKKLRKLGYDTYMVFVDTSLETAKRRNKARAASGGQDVPDSYIETAWRGARKNLPKYERLFGARNVFVIDNDADVTKQAWSKVISTGLRKIANRILSRPLENPRGQEWLEQERENPTLDDPSRKKEWSKPEKPGILAQKFRRTPEKPHSPFHKAPSLGPDVPHTGRKGSGTGKEATQGRSRAHAGSVAVKQGKSKVDIGKAALRKARDRVKSG